MNCYRRFERSLLVVLVAGLLAGLLTVVPSTSVRAANITIPAGDVAALIAAINTANSNGEADTIVLAENATYTLNSAADNNDWYGPSGLPAMTSDIVIEGNGATITRDTTAANFRVLLHLSGRLTLRNLTLSNGLADGTEPLAGWGGCVLSNSSLMVENSTLTGCSAAVDGAAMLVASTSADIVITGSTFYDNIGDYSTIRADFGASLTMSNSTLTDNIAPFGVGITTAGTVGVFTNVTITSTLPTIYAEALASASASGSILVPMPGSDTGSGYTDLGGNIYAINAQLGPLQNNGGTTLTRMPLAGSPAIEGGGTGCLLTDQRGIARPQGSACDAGAVEVTDATAPVITPVVTGTLGNNGWYTTEVTVSWQITEPESRVTSAIECGNSTITTDTSGITLTCTATSVGGTNSQSVTIKRDATAPVLAPTVSPNPVEIGQPATASPNATDATSGIATQSCPTPDTSTVGVQTVTCTATDLAGNTATAPAGYTVTDPTAPVITPTISGTLGSNGWYTSDVAVNWTVSDPESGISSSSGCDPTTITTDTAGTTLTCTATSAGGTTSASETIKRDATAPTVTFTGNQGVYGLGDTVSITCEASDATSGIASDTCADVSGPASSFGPGTHVRSASATDLAGNVTTVEMSFTVGIGYDGLIAVTREYISNPLTESRAVLLLRLAQAADARGLHVVEAAALTGYRITVATAVRLRHISSSDAQRLIDWSKSL